MGFPVAQAKLFKRLPLLLVALSTLVTASGCGSIKPSAPRRQGIKWKNCSSDDRIIECGHFEVPLDYSNAAAGKASLAVARYNATSQEQKLGVLFLNPGGPGSSGIDKLIFDETTAERIMKAVDGRYDLVSWDPRGVTSSNPDRSAYKTCPRVDCFANAAKEEEFWGDYSGIEAPSTFIGTESYEALYQQVGQVDGLLDGLRKSCSSRSGDVLKYIGTAATVRDLVELHRTVAGVNASINYWGFSYGTVLGNYLVNNAEKFKTQIGRVVLDGVVDPVYYTTKPAHEIWAIDIKSTDRALDGFLRLCVEAGPEKCELTEEGFTTTELKEKILTLIDSAFKFKGTRKTKFGSASVRKQLLGGMFRPSGWPELAKALQSCWKKLEQGLDCDTEVNPDPQAPLALPASHAMKAITCADATGPDGVTTTQVFKEIEEVTKSVSTLFGPMWVEPGFYCHKWPERAAERMTGPWNRALASPILVIGNQADPVTPLESAQNVANALGPFAVLVQQANWGHTSLAMESECMLRTLRDYFVNGQVPKAGLVCETDQNIFNKATATATGPPSTPVMTDSISTKREDSNLRMRGLLVGFGSAVGLLLILLLLPCVGIGRALTRSKRDWYHDEVLDKKDRHAYNAY